MTAKLSAHRESTRPRRLAPVAALACALLAACAAAPANLGQPAGSPVRLGATVAEARQALGTGAEPVRDAMPPAELTLAADAQGVQLFFDQADRVRTVRLRPPYAAPVLGVRIGDSAARVLATQGKPSAKASASGQTGYTYHPDSITILTYMVGADDRVEAIFLVR